MLRIYCIGLRCARSTNKSTATATTTIAILWWRSNTTNQPKCWVKYFSFISTTQDNEILLSIYSFHFLCSLLYVSTLDGKVSALDILDDGQKKWTINTTPGPMISSSIQNLELTNNGQWVRMIPSLSGSIYKFDGETVEPIPISADHLLSSSYKYSDDLVISGTFSISTWILQAFWPHLFSNRW